MQLSKVEQEMLDQGGAVAQALRQQIAVGDFFDAPHMVEIANAHFTGDPEVFGEAGLEYLEGLTLSGVSCRVPTTRNATCVDLEQLESFNQLSHLSEQELEVRRTLTKLGVMVVNTCIGYQTVYQPQLGEHVAWGDTGTVAYANSVLGARSNYEAGPSSLLAGITGRTPAYGFHLDKNRAAQYVVTVTAPLTDPADWGAVGAMIGSRYRGYDNVVAIVLENGSSPNSDDLKYLSASISSYGSMAMFHVVGITPEAFSLEQATQGQDPRETSEITAKDLAEFLGWDDTDIPDVVVFTAPQLSLFEVARLSSLLEGREVLDGTTVIATTSQMVYQEAERQGYIGVLLQAGVRVIKDTCWYLMDPAGQLRDFGWQTLMTSSSKLANIVKAHGYTPTVLPVAECIVRSTRKVTP
ncbi:hypothetical protein CQ019_06125 [Arthrobacter sp. MYb229]|uniref:aconitase X catalytic domain-containing protein n=1 Tax=unclassified Arthrobacter TaxID=235627 RepID=UPI000CFE0854|nr:MULTISPECIES: aconitase X catalytic domain-containing protein [unclassified Arthrobacter]PRA06923.1 hypothetical protein CQ019_06125 [Arthrobacter sp. MYb229]PRB47871.1 hypothetical protein CQ013_15920 [Arthrobacter sp. MYb216]